MSFYGDEGVIVLATYSADLVRTFPDGIHIFGAFSAGSDEGFSYDQFSRLELPDLGPFVVAGKELLLVSCNAGDCLLVLLIFQI